MAKALDQNASDSEGRRLGERIGLDIALEKRYKYLRIYLFMRLERRVRNLMKKGRKKPFLKVRLPTSITPDLCRLIGLLHGDGNMSGGRVLFTDQNKEFHKSIRGIFKSVFGVNLNTFHDVNRNSYYSHTKSVLAYRFLTEVMEVPKGAVRQNLYVPAYMKKLSRSLQAEYVGGLFDAEGCVKKRQAELNISTTSKSIFEFLEGFLSGIDVKYSTYIRTRHRNPEYEIYIYGKDDLHKFARYVSFKHRSKRRRLARFLKCY